ncbi:DNA cytosine methyltransferase [Streptomyces sp. NPDC090025]|uniref:DNA cytosine methyltransferase n=1 Tax=Streptomyces sp. NPDC090025 TaxID=3365922 RepID=UPI00383887C3
MSHIATEPSPPAGHRILDLFAGPGGLDVAAHVLGHQVTGIEWDRDACATRAKAGMDTFMGDVRAYRASFFPEADVLTGGPPCQTFTVAGHGAGRRALDDVLTYIDRLHQAVRENPLSDGLKSWRNIFGTWRAIHEELRIKELEAKEVRAEKRAIEVERGKLRKEMRDRLTALDASEAEVKAFFKHLRRHEPAETSDTELTALVERFGEHEGLLTKLKDRLEELGDERTGLVLQPLWWVIERSRRPGSAPYEAVILEQVRTVLPVWDRYALVLGTLGYRTRTQVLHTEAFGVPQTRRRAVLMARLGPGGELPEITETHERYLPGGRPAPAPKARRTAPPQTDMLQMEIPEPAATPAEDDPKDGWVSMRTALDRARKLDTALPERPAFTVVSNYGTGGDPEARGERGDDLPSATVTGKVSRNRVVCKATQDDLDRFWFAESGVLQTFPVAYPWSGKDVPQQIGNAVPPLLALHMLRHVLGPELSTWEERKAWRDRVTRTLETWELPATPVELREQDGLKGHPLTGR